MFKIWKDTTNVWRVNLKARVLNKTAVPSLERREMCSPSCWTLQRFRYTDSWKRVTLSGLQTGRGLGTIRQAAWSCCRSWENTAEEERERERRRLRVKTLQSVIVSEQEMTSVTATATNYYMNYQEKAIKARKVCNSLQSKEMIMKEINTQILVFE